MQQTLRGVRCHETSVGTTWTMLRAGRQASPEPEAPAATARKTRSTSSSTASSGSSRSSSPAGGAPQEAVSSGDPPAQVWFAVKNANMVHALHLQKRTSPDPSLS